MIDRMAAFTTPARLRSIGSMPRDARRAFERAHERRARRRPKKRRPTSRKCSRPRDSRVPTKADGSVDVGALIDGMRKAVRRKDPVDRFLDVTGSVPVPDFIVADWRIEMAEKAAARAAGRLGMDAPPAVRWFQVPKGGPEARGYFDPRQPDAIWLRADLLPSEIPGTVAHEAAHRADHLQGRESTEERAEAFAASFTPPPSRGAVRTHQRGQFVAPTTN